MAITKWTDANCSRLRTDLQLALKSVLLKHGIDMSGISMRYNSAKNTVKFDLNVKPENVASNPTININEEGTAYNQYGLPIGTVLRSDRYGRCVVTGYKRSSPKYPVIAKNDAGQIIKFSPRGAIVISYPNGYVPKPQPAFSRF